MNLATLVNLGVLRPAPLAGYETGYGYFVGPYGSQCRREVGSTRTRIRIRQPESSTQRLASTSTPHQSIPPTGVAGDSTAPVGSVVLRAGDTDGVGGAGLAQGPTLGTTQEQIDGFFRQLPFKCLLPEKASVED